jgi:hypothetical protein
MAGLNILDPFVTEKSTVKNYLVHPRENCGQKTKFCAEKCHFWRKNMLQNLAVSRKYEVSKSIQKCEKQSLQTTVSDANCISNSRGKLAAYLVKQRLGWAYIA